MTNEEFSIMRAKGNYSELGNRFFQLFVTLNKGDERTRVGNLWESLTKKEKSLCEGVN